MKVMELAWNEINVDDSVVVIGIAPVEEHGKHLPLGVDYYLTEKWKEAVDEKLTEKEGMDVYTLPTIPIGSADIGDFCGNLHVKQSTVYHVTKDILVSICKWGIRNIIIISAHADPKHLIAIEQACEFANRKYGVVAISPMGAIFSGEKVGVENVYSDLVKEQLEKYPNDFHAGWIETSLMMYYNRSAVRDEYINAVDIELTEKDMIRTKLVNEQITGVGHIGYPRLATEALGKDLHEDMICVLIDAIIKFMNRDRYEKYRHHFLYKIPFLKVSRFRR